MKHDLNRSEIKATNRWHICYSLNFGGTESQLIALAETYALKRSSSVAFVSLTSSGYAGDLIRSLGLPVISLHLKAFIPDIKSSFELFRLMRKSKVSEVICHGAEANFHGIIAAFLSRKKVRITEEIGVVKRSFLANLVFSIIFKMATLNIVASNQVFKSVKMIFHKNLRKTIILYPPLRREFTLDQPNSAFKFGSPYKFLFIGRFEPIKQLEALVLTFNQILIRYPHSCSLTLAGDGSLKNALVQLVGRLGLSDSVFFENSRGNTFEIFQRHDYYIQFSESEGFGLSAVEAWSQGLPVISRKTGIAFEYLHDSVNGFVVDEKQSLFACIERCLETPKHNYLKMLSASKLTVQKIYMINSYVEQLDNEIQGRSR